MSDIDQIRHELHHRLVERLATQKTRAERIGFLDLKEGKYDIVCALRADDVKTGDYFEGWAQLQVSNHPRWSLWRRFNAMLAVWMVATRDLKYPPLLEEMNEAGSENIDNRIHHGSKTICGDIIYEAKREIPSLYFLLLARGGWYKARKGDRLRVDEDYAKMVIRRWRDV